VRGIGGGTQAAKAVLEAAHAVVCERGQWVCNEKWLIDAADLGGVHALFSHVPSEVNDLVRWVDDIAGRLGVPVGDAVTWRAPRR
jgi:hypothetical protein